MAADDSYYQYDANWPPERKKGDRMQFKATDDLMIIKYFLKTRDVLHLGGNEIWKKLETSRKFNPRGFSNASLKERWRKVIQKSIERYGLADEKMEMLLCKPPGFFKQKREQLSRPGQRDQKIFDILTDEEHSERSLNSSTSREKTPTPNQDDNSPSIEAVNERSPTPDKHRKKIFREHDCSVMAETIVSAEDFTPSRVVRNKTGANKKVRKTPKSTPVGPRRIQKPKESPFESSTSSEEERRASKGRKKQQTPKLPAKSLLKVSSQQILRNVVVDSQASGVLPPSVLKNSPRARSNLQESSEDEMHRVMCGALVSSQSSQRSPSTSPGKRVTFSTDVQDKEGTPPKSPPSMNTSNFKEKDLQVLLHRLPADIESSTSRDLSALEARLQNGFSQENKADQSEDLFEEPESETHDDQDEDYVSKADEGDGDTEEEYDSDSSFGEYRALRRSPRKSKVEPKTRRSTQDQLQKLVRDTQPSAGTSSGRNTRRNLRYCDISTDSSDEDTSHQRKRNSESPQTNPAKKLRFPTDGETSMPNSTITASLDDTVVDTDTLVHTKCEGAQIKVVFTMQRSFGMPITTPSTPPALVAVRDLIKATFEQHGIYGCHGCCPGLGEFLFICSFLNSAVVKLRNKPESARWQGPLVDKFVSTLLQFDVCSRKESTSQIVVKDCYKAILRDEAWQNLLSDLAQIYREFDRSN